MRSWVGAVATPVLRVWIFNNTGGSVFAIIVAHTLANIRASYIPTVPTSSGGPVLVVLAVLVTALWGPETLARYRFATGTR